MRLEWGAGPWAGRQTGPEPGGGGGTGPWSRDGQRVGGSRGRDSSSGIRAEGCSAGPVGCARPGLWGCKDPGDRPPRTERQASGSWGRVRSPWDRPWAGRQAGSELRGCSKPSWGCRASSGVQRAGSPLPSAGFAETSCQSRGARAAPRLGRLGGRRAAALCPRSAAPGPRVPPPAPPAARPRRPRYCVMATRCRPGSRSTCRARHCAGPDAPPVTLAPRAPPPPRPRPEACLSVPFPSRPSPQPTDPQPGRPGAKVHLWSAYGVP